MMDPERTPLVADEAGSPSGGSTHAHGVTIGRSPAGAARATAAPAEFVVTNGYDELLHSLVTDTNLSFRNVHLQSRVGITRVSLGGVLIGVVVGVNAAVFCSAVAAGNGALVQWCLYVFVLSVFHYMEFLCTAAFKPRDVSYDSYLINHSTAYTIAAVSSWLEFWVEYAVAPSLKGRALVVALGVLAVVAFQCIRSLAMITAGRNFNHIVQDEVRAHVRPCVRPRVRFAVRSFTSCHSIHSFARHSFTHSFMHSFIDLIPCIHSIVHSFIRPSHSMHSFALAFIINSLLHSFAHPFIHSSIHSSHSLHSFARSIIH